MRRWVRVSKCSRDLRNAGAGIKILRAGRVDVSVGLLECDAIADLAPYLGSSSQIRKIPMQPEEMPDNIDNDRFTDQGVQPIDPANREVLGQLIKREPIFHRSEFGTTRQDFENMTIETFWEVGASGRRYSREYVMDTLELRHSQPHEDIWETQDFHCLEISPDNYLITYTLIQGDRVTRRSTIWRRCGSDWKIIYHQGTIVEDD